MSFRKTFEELKLAELRALIDRETYIRSSLAVAEGHWALIDSLCDLAAPEEGWCTVDSCSPNVNLLGDKAVLQEAFKLLRAAGWEPDSRPGEAKQQSFSTAFRKGDDTIWLYFTSKVCRQVQVGTRTVEEPVYEVICE